MISGRHFSHIGVAAIGMLVNLFVARSAWAGNFPISLVVDTTTPIPGTTTVFSNLGSTPTVNGVGNVVFAGGSSTGLQGVFFTAAHEVHLITAIATNAQPIPGGTGDFNFSIIPPNPSINSVSAVFTATGSNGQAGVYEGLGGGVRLVVNTNNPSPSGAGNFTFSLHPPDPDVFGNEVVFAGDSNGAGAGVYAELAGGLFEVASTNTPIPGGTGDFNFSQFSPAPVVSFDFRIAFVGEGSGGQAGIYERQLMAPISVVVNTKTSMPGGGTWVPLGPSNQSPIPSLYQSNVAFIANTSTGNQGVFKDINESILDVADLVTPIPGGSGDFTSFDSMSFDGSTVAFLANGSGGQEGIYTDFNGKLAEVIDLSDTLDGKSIASLGFSQFGMNDGPRLVFQADFTDGSEGVFMVLLPEPGCVPIMALVMATIICLRPHRRPALA